MAMLMIVDGVDDVHVDYADFFDVDDNTVGYVDDIDDVVDVIDDYVVDDKEVGQRIGISSTLHWQDRSACRPPGSVSRLWRRQ